MDLETFRREKDQFMKSHPRSPLTPEQQEEFTSLNYFPENPALCFDVALTPDPDRPIVAIETSGGVGRFYRRAGTTIVIINGAPHQLVIYLPEQGDGYFLPFTDETTAKETYGGGRYIEPAPLPDGSLHIDFNLAYNPYCAYNDRWSCAIPPRENMIAARIEAGEKAYGVTSDEWSSATCHSAFGTQHSSLVRPSSPAARTDCSIGLSRPVILLFLALLLNLP